MDDRVQYARMIVRDLAPSRYPGDYLMFRNRAGKKINSRRNGYVRYQ